jgi:hypothetical protein
MCVRNTHSSVSHYSLSVPMATWAGPLYLYPRDAYVIKFMPFMPLPYIVLSVAFLRTLP